jgi:hypothetical protein
MSRKPIPQFATKPKKPSGTNNVMSSQKTPKKLRPAAHSNSDA